MAGELCLLAGDVGLEVGDRLQERIVRDDVHSPLRRCVEAHEPRLALLDPKELGDRLEPWAVIGPLALDDAPRVPRHAVHLLQHGLLHLGGAPHGDRHLARRRRAVIDYTSALPAPPIVVVAELRRSPGDDDARAVSISAPVVRGQL